MNPSIRTLEKDNTQGAIKGVATKKRIIYSLSKREIGIITINWKFFNIKRN